VNWNNFDNVLSVKEREGGLHRLLSKNAGLF